MDRYVVASLHIPNESDRGYAVKFFVWDTENQVIVAGEKDGTDIERIANAWLRKIKNTEKSKQNIFTYEDNSEYFENEDYELGMQTYDR